MRKRRRLANKMTIMVCAVLIAVSAFFYAPMEVSAKTVWYTDWLNFGDGTQIDYTIAGLDSHLSTWVNVTAEQYPNGDVRLWYNKSPGTTYDTYTLNWGMPLGDWYGSELNLDCEKLGIKFYVDIYPTLDLNVPNTLYSDFDINITSVQMVFQGRSYECDVIPLSDGRYRCLMLSSFDVPSGNARLANSYITLKVNGYMSGYIHIRDGSTTGLASAIINPRAVFRVGGIGGPYKFQYKCGEESSFSSSDLQEQTDELNSNSDKNTNSLINGFDSTQGDSVNSDLSAGLNEFQTAEDSLFATASSGLDDFSFFNFASIPAMVTGMSFVSSIMTSWFNQAGGASGVGIVLSILFSIMLVAMVLGLYRWYQSKGGKD